MSPYNTAGLMAEDSEEVVTQIAKNCRRRQPHSHLTPPPRGTPTNIPINLIFPDTIESLTYICVADSMGDGSMFIQICAVGSKRRIFSATECVLAVQGHSRSFKVDDFGTNQKRACDFLLVINSNFGPILHRFRDTATYLLKCLFFLTLSHSAPSIPRFPLEFRAEVNHEETRVMGLSYNEDPMIIA